MEGPLYHFLIVLPVFVLVLMFLVLPLLQWVSTRLFDRKFILRFGGRWDVRDEKHRWDVTFSVIAFVLSLAVSLLALKLLIIRGILPPMG